MIRWSITFVFFLSIVLAGKAQVKTNEYENIRYQFKVNVPQNWRLYGSLKHDSVNNKSIVAWGLPEVFSYLENASIENAISIIAVKRPDVACVEDLILQEKMRLDPQQWSMKTDSTNTNARIMIGSIGGKNYKGKSYFLYKNGIGYVVNFTATPGTYDINIAPFENFYKSIQFL